MVVPPEHEHLELVTDLGYSSSEKGSLTHKASPTMSPKTTELQTKIEPGPKKTKYVAQESRDNDIVDR